MIIVVKRDTQSQKYSLTINNPIEKGFSHEEIRRTLKDNFSTLEYYCMADEMGETFHTHIFVFFRSRVRFSTIKRHFEKAHIEVARSTPTANRNYILKADKWENTDKSETRIEGSFEEGGKLPPDTRGKRYDMTELYEMVQDGLSDADIIAVNQDYIMHIDKISKLRTMILTERYKEELRTDIKVIYISGETGTYKTSGVLKEHGARNVYRVTDYDHPFDGYSCQPVIAFDEFRSSLRLKDMLNYCDIYPLELPARYNNRYCCYHTVYIISNWSLEEQYHELQISDKKSWEAFLRRIHEVRVHTKEGVTVYHSVKEYFEREAFCEVTKEDLPFD